MGPKTERLTILHAATNETELGDQDFCLSRLHYSGWPQRESNLGPPHQESRALPTELPPPPHGERNEIFKNNNLELIPLALAAQVLPQAIFFSTVAKFDFWFTLRLIKKINRKLAELCLLIDVAILFWLLQVFILQNNIISY